MPAHDRRALIDQLTALLTQQRYNPSSFTTSKRALPRVRSIPPHESYSHRRSLEPSSRIALGGSGSFTPDRASVPGVRESRACSKASATSASSGGFAHILSRGGQRNQKARGPHILEARRKSRATFSVTRLICFIWLAFSPSPDSGGKRPNGHSPSQWPACGHKRWWNRRT